MPPKRRSRNAHMLRCDRTGDGIAPNPHFSPGGPGCFKICTVFKAIERMLLSALKQHTVLFGFRPNLALHLGRSSFHLRLAFLPSWLVRACPSLVKPFTGGKVHWTFPFVQLTHSYGYASADDRPSALRLPCFARSPAHTALYRRSWLLSRHSPCFASLTRNSD